MPVPKPKTSKAADFLGEILFILIDKAVEKWDYKAWLKKYAKRIITKLDSKIDFNDIDDELQEEVWDPVKKFFEKLTGLNF